MREKKLFRIMVCKSEFIKIFCYIIENLIISIVYIDHNYNKIYIWEMYDRIVQ